MHNPLAFEPDEDDCQHFPRNPYEPHTPPKHESRFGKELPRFHAGTHRVLLPCPACESHQTTPRHHARRIGGAVGAAAGAISAATAALSGAELGAAVGIAGGPFGMLCGALGGAVIAGLAGAAAGCATGAALGNAIDQNVLDNWHCHGCGHTFSVRPD